MTSLAHILLFGFFVMLGAFGMSAFQDALGPVARFWRRRQATRPLSAATELRHG